MADNYFGITDTGLVRTNNEDAFVVQKVLQGRYILACVIDGVGGYDGGEVAAALARDSILNYFSVSSGDVVTMMKEAFAVAAQKIAAEKARVPQYESMACVATLALVDLSAKTFSFAHIGDTRLYLWRDGSLVKISKDQSFVGYLEDSGRIGEAEAMRHPKRNEINNAIGFEATLNMAEIETGTSPFLPGDLLLLCSDGLSDLVTSSEMASVLAGDTTLAAKGGELIAKANERGGKDNITVVLVRNGRKPVLQKATKPAQTFSNAHAVETKVTEIATNSSAPSNKIPPKNKRGLSVLMGLCLVLTAAVVLLLVERFGLNKNATTVALQKEGLEAALQNAFDTVTANSFTVPDSIAATPLAVHDTLWIQQDSLQVRGGGMGFLKSSTYSGPALALAKTCRYVLLENMVFQDFDVAVLVQNRALHLKNVRFINCRVPVQAAASFPDSVAVSGTLHHFFTPDSLFQ